MKTELRERFGDVYFAYLMSGNARDFRDAARLLESALDSGSSLGEMQETMDADHHSAELLCVLVGAAT